MQGLPRWKGNIKKYLLCSVKLDCKNPLTMLAVLFESCVSARLIRGTGLREEWHGRRSYLALPFSHSYDLPICNLRSFPSYTNTKLERRLMAHQISLKKYPISNSKCVSKRTSPSPNSMLVREFAKVPLPWSTLIRRKKKKHWLGAGMGGGTAVLSRRKSVAFSRVLSKIVIYDKTEIANLPSGLISLFHSLSKTALAFTHKAT